MVSNIRALKNNIRIYSMLPDGYRVLPGSGTYIAHWSVQQWKRLRLEAFCRGLPL